MRFKLSLLSLVILSCPAFAVDDDTSTDADTDVNTLVSRIDKIEFSQNLVGLSSHQPRTERVYFSDTMVCDQPSVSMTHDSLGMDRAMYRDFLKDLWQKSKDNYFFSVTTTACRDASTVNITSIQPCKKGKCDDKYLIEENVIWLDDDLQATSASDAVIAVRQPLVFDKSKQAWQVKGWYTQHPEHASTQISRRIALYGYYSDSDMQKAHQVGEFTRYYRNGKKQLTQHFDEKGKQTGTQTTWYDDGALQQTAIFVDGQLDGVVTNYHANGQVESSEVYIAGQHQDGECTHYDKDGKISRQHHFRNGKYHGQYVDYYPTGIVHINRLYQNGVIQRSQTYLPNGHIAANYQREGDHAVTDKYNARGKVIEREMHVTDQQGTYLSSREYRYESGQSKSIELYNRGGRKQGDMVTWYQDGTIQKKEKYENGELQALQRWAPNGTMIEESFFHNGMRQGFHRKWSGATGKLIYEAKYQDGDVVSPVKTYDQKTGQLVSVEYQTSAGKTQSQFVNGNPPLKVYDNNQIVMIGCGDERLDNPEQIRAQALGGDSPSQYTIGQFYANCGETKQAMGWLTKAASSNNRQALRRLIDIYASGQGQFSRMQSYPKAWRYIKQASDLNLPAYVFEEAFQYLPKAFATQYFPDRVVFDFVRADETRAFELMKGAADAEQRDYVAVRALGLMYQHGIGTPVDKDLAIQYFEQLGQEDPAQAQALIDQVQ